MYTRIFTLYIYNRLVQKSTRSNVHCTKNSQIPHLCPPESFMSFHYILVQNRETPCFRNFPFKNRNIQTFFIFLQMIAPPYMATCPFSAFQNIFIPGVASILSTNFCAFLQIPRGPIIGLRQNHHAWYICPIKMKDSLLLYIQLNHHT